MAYSNSSHDQSVDSWSLRNVEYHTPTPNPEANITMSAGSGDEMLKITRDGFYVRGERVPADDKEAEAVYLAFKQWLAWANLQQRR